MSIALNSLTLWTVVVLGLVFLPCSADAQRRKSTTKDPTVVTLTLPAEDERRKSVEERMFKGDYQHDGSLELRYIGTLESVPALLKVLKDLHPIEREPEIPVPPSIPGQPPVQIPKKPLYFICTYHHAVQTLRRITGQNLNYYPEWNEWWERNRPQPVTPAQPRSVNLK